MISDRATYSRGSLAHLRADFGWLGVLAWATGAVVWSVVIVVGVVWVLAWLIP